MFYFIKTYYFYFLFCIISANASDLALFDTNVLGQNTSTSIKLLLDKSGDINPFSIQVDVSQNKYYAATIKYSTDMSLNDARKSLNRIYQQWQRPDFADDAEMGLWHVEKGNFSIQLTKDTNQIVIIYISHLKFN